MKKLMLAVVLMASTAFLAVAQDTKQKKETKTTVKTDNGETTTTVKDEKTTKRTSSATQKVHNTFSKDKQYNGKKTKHKKVVEKKATTEEAK